ncbi:MAG: dihydrodipicolinate synthase family protein [Candidatus Bathyarchaeia archaeon]
MFKLEGIMPPMLTPFTPDEEIDEDALKGETRYMVKAGVQGLTVCGSTGEGYTMTSEEIGLVTNIVKGEVGSKLPVISGVITDSTRMAIKHGLSAKENGADALMVTPFHYIFHPTSEGMIDYYRKIGDNVGLPIVIYNVIPWNTVSANLAAKLVETGYLMGIKQSGGDIHGLADMIRSVGDEISIMTAIDDMLLPSFIIGAQGAIAAICTIAPELCVELWEAAKKGDLKKGIEIHHRLLPVWRAVDRGVMPSAAKEAVSQLGRKVGVARSPLFPLDDDAKKEIHKALVEAKLLRK